MSDSLTERIAPLLDALSPEYWSVHEWNEPDQFADRHNALQVLAERLREAKAAFERSAAAVLEKKGPIEQGPIRYYSGGKRIRKCKDVKQAAQAILSTHSVEDLIQCLSASALKMASTRTVLGDAFSEHFQDDYERDEEGNIVPHFKVIHKDLIK